MGSKSSGMGRAMPLRVGPWDWPSVWDGVSNARGQASDPLRETVQGGSGQNRPPDLCVFVNVWLMQGKVTVLLPFTKSLPCDTSVPPGKWIERTERTAHWPEGTRRSLCYWECFTFRGHLPTSGHYQAAPGRVLSRCRTRTVNVSHKG